MGLPLAQGGAAMWRRFAARCGRCAPAIAVMAGGVVPVQGGADVAGSRCRFTPVASWPCRRADSALAARGAWAPGCCRDDPAPAGVWVWVWVPAGESNSTARANGRGSGCVTPRPRRQAPGPSVKAPSGPGSETGGSWCPTGVRARNAPSPPLPRLQNTVQKDKKEKKNEKSISIIIELGGTY